MSHIVLFKRTPNKIVYERLEHKFSYLCRKGLCVSSFQSLEFESPASNLILISLGLGWLQLFFAAVHHWLSMFWRWDQDSPFCRAGDLSPSKTSWISLYFPIESPALWPLESSDCSLTTHTFSSVWRCLLVLLPPSHPPAALYTHGSSGEKNGQVHVPLGSQSALLSYPNLPCCSVAHKSVGEMENKVSK